MSKDVLENEVNRPRTAPRSCISVVAAAVRRLLTEQLLKGLMPLYVVRKPAHYILLLNNKLKYFLKNVSHFHASSLHLRLHHEIFEKKKLSKKQRSQRKKNLRILHDTTTTKSNSKTLDLYDCFQRV